MRYNVTGDILQILNVEIDEGDEFIACADAMIFMTEGISMVAKLSSVKGMKNVVSKRTEHMAIFKSNKDGQKVGLGGGLPGKIVELNTSEGWVFQMPSLIGFEKTVETEMLVQKKLSSTQFSHSGLVLQSLEGKGKAFISAAGDYHIMDLKAGEKYLISTANALAWESSVKFEISTVPGLKTAMFGAESIFLTTLTGPGKIVIQSMNPGYSAAIVSSFLPK